MEFDSLAPIAELTGGIVRRSVAIPNGSDAAQDAPAREPRRVENPAEVLATLMDFSGSVALAELLHAPPSDGAPHPEAKRLARKLQEQVRARLESLLTQVLSPLTGKRAPALPSALDLLLAIERATGEPGRVPDAEAAKRLARDLGAPLCAALRTSLRQAQAQLGTLRWRISAELRELGPRADRLERIDAALQRSIQIKLGELFDRMELAAELSFELACVRACGALPDGFGLNELADWAASGGWIAHYRERCIGIAQALFGHLRRSLEGLLLAAIDAEVV